jgi:hypothetical protein
MVKRISLDDLIDGIELQNEDITAYLDCESGEVVAISAEMAAFSDRNQLRESNDLERELSQIVREIGNGSKRYVQLPTKWEVHEWDLMRNFSNEIEDVQVRELLLRQIHSRGAFRRFKDELERHGLLGRWFDFKRNALREYAVEWCTENEIPFD